MPKNPLSSPLFQNEIFLYLVTTLIWGSTWLFIKFQVDTASPIVSVFYRFSIACFILFAFCWFTKAQLKWSAFHHRNFLLQGIFNFSLNYIFTYIAEMLTTSGLVALTFTTIIYFNMAGLRIFFGKRFGANILLGSLFGILGLCLIFWNEIQNFNPESKTWLGLLIGLIATVFASAGNMFTTRNHLRKVPVASANAWGMFYGTLLTGAVGLAMSQNFLFQPTTKFFVSLVYLSVFGTVIAFGAYISLVGKIGADRASYSGIVSPVIALTLSSFFENFQWSTWVVAGMALCLIGNVITLRQARA